MLIFYKPHKNPVHYPEMDTEACFRMPLETGQSDEWGKKAAGDGTGRGVGATSGSRIMMFPGPGKEPLARGTDKIAAGVGGGEGGDPDLYSSGNRTAALKWEKGFGEKVIKLSF